MKKVVKIYKVVMEGKVLEELRTKDWNVEDEISLFAYYEEMNRLLEKAYSYVSGYTKAFFDMVNKYHIDLSVEMVNSLPTVQIEEVIINE